MHFFLRVCEEYITEKNNDIANQLCTRAIKSYLLQNKDSAAQLKPGEWYDKRVDEAIKKHKKTLVHLIK